jgi:hypothetical protein
MNMRNPDRRQGAGVTIRLRGPLFVIAVACSLLLLAATSPRAAETPTATATAKTGTASATGTAPAPTEAAKKAVYPKPEEMDALAQRDPLAFLKAALTWSEANITDYTCRFVKQEKIAGEMGSVETMDLKLRESTFSVYVKWVADPSKGQEVIYWEGSYDNKAVVHPSGFIGILFRKVSIDPTSKLALKHARRPITNAGMANMLRLVIPQCDEAKENGDLTLTYEGLRDEGGRPAHVFKRVLPKKGDYPCPILMIYVDREYLACVRTDAYDWDGSLLSQYIYSDLVINPGLTDLDFDPDNKTYGYRLF